MMTAVSSLRAAAAATAVVLTSCARDPLPPMVIRSSADVPEPRLACPLAFLRGVRARVADVPLGVAILFDGPGRVVDLLRANVRAMATAAGDPQGDPFDACPCAGSLPGAAGLPDAMGGAPSDRGGVRRVAQMEGPPSSYFPPSTATVEETPSGATLVLSAEDAVDVDGLRMASRHAVSAMGSCLSPPGL